MPTTPNPRHNGPALPPLYACEFCGAEVNPSAPDTWRKVTGWVQSRKGGGIHALSFPSSALSWACALCMMDKKLGINKGQDTLF